jgi:acetoin:2,6-dichlorophenolindophenol oxidoreductase subunit alpha
MMEVLTVAPIQKGLALRMYEQMTLIRAFEERCSTLYAAAEIEGAMHLSAGQEAVAVGVCVNLEVTDWITSTHRPHHHAIAKGVDVDRMMAELHGRATGICGGKGGSMHLADIEHGFLGANGVVAAGVPLACGAALTAKLRQSGQVAVSFFGDGAADEGATHEAMNLAAVWRLPIVFVCENNGFAQTTPVGYHCPVPNIAERAAAYAMPGVTVDGLDVVAVYEAARKAVRAARHGDGPSLIEARTWRFYGHFEGDQQVYRTAQQRSEYRGRDPNAAFGARLIEWGFAGQADLDGIRERSVAAVDGAVGFARQSPWPDPSAVTTDLYATSIGG